MYCDCRVPSQEIWHFDEPADSMQIPDVVMKCVVFVGYQMADGRKRYAGTAVFLARPADFEGRYFTYLATAAHVIRGIKNKGVNQVLIRVNQKHNGAVWFSTKLEDWKIPDDSTVDVAVISQGISDTEFEHLAWPTPGALTTFMLEANRVGVGDDVFVIGLFSPHTGKRNNIPIARVGNIAALPREKVSTKIGDIDAYLIECRSIGGLSGSPVFIHMGGDTRIRGQFSKPLVQYFLLGMMHGHFDISADTQEDIAGSDSVNMGIGIVVPIDHVLNFMEDAFGDEEKQYLKDLKDKNLPVMDSLDDNKTPSEFTQADFEAALRKVSRKIESEK